MSAYRSLAIIIKTYNYSEADRVVVAFTQKYGKVRAVAKGVRKIHSRLAACTGLLSLSELQFHGKEKQDLALITQGQLHTAFLNIKKDLQVLTQALRLCEVLDRLTPEHQPQLDLFAAAHHTLGLLEQGIAAPLVGLWADIICLDLLGYGPRLAACAVCGKDAELMAYVPEKGSVVCCACGHGSSLVLSRGARLLLEKLRSAPPGKVGRFRVDSRMEKELRVCLDEAFHYQLGRTLNTQKFSRAIAKAMAGKSPHRQ